MAASMWEVIGLVLDAPGDAAAIAQQHAFTPHEVAELLPLYLDNASVSWADGPAVPALDAPGGDAAGWLAEMGQRLHGTIEVASYDRFGMPGLSVLDDGLDDFTDLATGFDAGPDTGAHAGGGPGPAEVVQGDPAADATFGAGAHDPGPGEPFDLLDHGLGGSPDHAVPGVGGGPAGGGPDQGHPAHPALDPALFGQSDPPVHGTDLDEADHTGEPGGAHEAHDAHGAREAGPELG